MTPIWLIAVLPAVLVFLGFWPKAANWLPRAAAGLMVLQLPIAVWLCLPAFLGTRVEWDGFAIDGIGAAFTCITTLVVAAAMVQAAFLLPAERLETPMSDRRFSMFYTLAGAFIIAMYAVPLAQNLGYMWMALEATTLMSAPLVDFHRRRSSLEATWKYLLLCSVGIAFALFGTVLIFAAQHSVAAGGSLSIATLMANAASVDPRLLRVGFVFCLLGYGTKAGIFPLHNWLPDAHSEAPAPVSAMLSGALLNCALVGIWRVSQIAVAAGQSNLVTGLLVPAGVITVLAASIMLVRQHDLKRLWAYSSVEHIGLLVIAIGLGAGPVFMLHAFNHSLAKTALFLMSGNVLQLFGTKSLSKISGLLRLAPMWGLAFIAAGFAISGSPPFGTFLSEWLLLRALLSGGQTLSLVVVLASLTITFLAILSHLAPVILGSERSKVEHHAPARWAAVPLCLMILSLVAGVAISPAVLSFLKSLAEVVAR